LIHTHIKSYTKSKLIRKFEVTDASAQASQVIDNLFNEDDNGEEFYADSAYAGQNIAFVIK